MPRLRTSADSTATGARSDSLATDTRLLEDTVTTTDASAVASDSLTSTSGGQIGFGFLLLGIGGILLFVFALPVIVIFGSLPGGLISALIIGFGMHQAWRMTGARKSEITGPFKVNVSPTAESAA